MILIAIKEGWKIDHILFFDNGILRDECYQAMEQLWPLTPTGITVVKPKHSYEYMLTEKPVKKERGDTFSGYGWPQRGLGWCCRWEQSTLRQFEKTIRPVIELQGVVTDDSAPDPERDSCKWRIIKYPMKDRNLSSKDSLSICKEKGFTFSGYYDRGNTHLSCWLCPYHHITEFRKLWQEDKPRWEELKRLDEMQHAVYRKSQSVSYWELKFEKEAVGDNESENFQFTLDIKRK